MDDAPAPPQVEALLHEVLGFLQPRDLGRAAAAASCWCGPAMHDSVWRGLCRARWESQQWTACSGALLQRLLRNEAPSGAGAGAAAAWHGREHEPAAGAKCAACGSDEPPAAGAAGSWPVPRPPSWRAAYREAEEAGLTVTYRDLCGDIGGCPRVWTIHRCPPPFAGPNEAVFRPDGTYSDTALFRGTKGDYTVVDCPLNVYGSRKVGVQLFFGDRPIPGVYSAHRLPDWGLELRMDTAFFFGREGPYFVATDRPADAEWERRVAEMDSFI